MGRGWSKSLTIGNAIGVASFIKQKESAIKKRVFTDEELREMGERTIDLLNQAIDAGDKEKA